MKFTNIRFIDPTNNGAENYYYNTDGAPTNMTASNSSEDLLSFENSIWKVSSSSKYDSNYPIWKAFCLNSVPRFLYHSGSEGTTWIKWQNKESKKAITSYSIACDVSWAIDNNNQNRTMGSGWYPSEWYLYGSDVDYENDDDWDELDHRSEISFSYGEKKTFTIPNQKSYYYYKIKKIAGRGSYFSPQAIMASTNTPVERPEETTNGLTPSTAWKNLPT